jgi:hypothetical protein
MSEPSEGMGTRLQFDNDRVRVWDLALGPGESLETHIHRRLRTRVREFPALRPRPEPR